MRGISQDEGVFKDRKKTYAMLQFQFLALISLTMDGAIN